MANLGHHTHALCHIPMMMSVGLCLSISTQSMPSLRNPYLIWFVVQFDQRSSPYLIDSSPLLCRYSLVRSIQWNYGFLPRRRFVSGDFPCRRCFFRFSTGDCLLTQGYGSFTWVFDPGINRVSVADKDIINLVETKTIRQAQRVTSGALVSLFVVVEDEIYVSDFFVSNRTTVKSIILIWMIRREASYKITGKLLLGLRLNGFLVLMAVTRFCLVVIIISCTTIQMARSLLDVFETDATSTTVSFSSTGPDYIAHDHSDVLMDFWLYQVGLCWFELLNLHMGLVLYWRQDFVGIARIGRLEYVLATLIWVLFDMRGSGNWDDMVNFLVVMLKRSTQAQYFKETLVRKCWCHYVYISELALDTSALMLRFVKRSHSQKLMSTIRNKEESNMKLDNNRFFDRLASKATLRKASSNSLLLYFLLVYGTYICVCNNCISLILYAFVISLLV